MPVQRGEAMGALDAAIAEADEMPDLPDEPIDDVPMAVTCDVCGTEIDTVTGEPIAEPGLEEGGGPPLEPAAAPPL